MEFTFTPVRVGILVALLAGFWFLGGYDFPVGEFAGLRRAWFYSVLMFVLGSVSATIVDHWVGNIDRSNLRFLYIVLGVLCIGGSFMYQNVLNERMKMGGKETIEAE
ncbi:hypothetical protein OKA04_20375 [Luteolibacter flavescens]|uniref:Uncharacterized protein n=1 Tax=Luteolibacter flavescens TaxID=1859460 RepID=A0ABT3FV59_9BACT|nr:hypothetical protein [Luteolibacter flavescens]MCW1887106.1 hypothetical protein [Luteolibacter flavescens]